MQQAKRPLNENGEDCMLGKLCRLSRVCGQRLSSPDLYSATAIGPARYGGRYRLFGEAYVTARGWAGREAKRQHDSYGHVGSWQHPLAG